MPVKSPEIIQVEKAESIDPVEIANLNLPETSVEVVITENDVTVVVQDNLHETDVIVSKNDDGDLKVSIIETESVPIPELKVSALSLKSIRAKKELEQSAKVAAKDEVHLPTEEFNETDMLLQWTKYAQRLSDKGQKIMESLMLINDPKLKGRTIVHELPNDSARMDFESGKHELLGYLRGKLHNHDIDIKVIVNESIDSRKAFTPQDRFNRLNEINPSLELLRKTFDLDF